MSTTASKQPQEAAVESPWAGFHGALWQREINVRAFIQLNYTPYDGDSAFLAPATERTKKVWGKLTTLFVEERKKGVLDISQVPSSITAHAPGYIDRELEIIVGLQTEAPLKRAIMPNGGLRMVLNALEAYGHQPDPHVVEAFSKYRKTHNEGVFDAYTSDIRKCRSSHVLTGLPDAYGRGRIIGDYRRVALYGVDRLIAHKQQEKLALDPEPSIGSDHPGSRRALRTGAGAAGTEGDGRELWLRHFGPGPDRSRGGAVAVLRVPRRGEGAERRGDVAGPLLDVPGRLLRAGHARRAG